jgi:hypothetical protein
MRGRDARLVRAEDALCELADLVEVSGLVGSALAYPGFARSRPRELAANRRAKVFAPNVRPCTTAFQGAAHDSLSNDVTYALKDVNHTHRSSRVHAYSCEPGEVANKARYAHAFSSEAAPLADMSSRSNEAEGLSRCWNAHRSALLSAVKTGMQSPGRRRTSALPSVEL